MPTLTLAPQQDGTCSGWSSIVGATFAYQAIDEASTDFDATYILIPRLILPAGRVSFPVFLQTEYARPTSIGITVSGARHSGSPVLEIGFYKSGDVAFSGSIFTPDGAGNPDEATRAFTTNPFTGSAWAASDLAGLEPCVQMQSFIIGQFRLSTLAVSLTYEMERTNWRFSEPIIRMTA